MKRDIKIGNKTLRIEEVTLYKVSYFEENRSHTPIHSKDFSYKDTAEGAFNDLAAVLTHGVDTSK